MIFQEPMASLSPVHTIGNQIIEAIRLHDNVGKARRASARSRCSAGSASRDPKRRVDAYPFELVGGMRQRAMIAMALSCQPQLLIADEPTTALDVTTQAQILDLLQELQDELGMAIMFITHDLGVVAEIADEVAVMYLGEVVEHGRVDVDLPRARSTPTPGRCSARCRGSGNAARAGWPPIAGTVPPPYDRPSGCPFHPRCDAFMAGDVRR